VPRQDEFERQVRDALVHLHDVVYLQTHPLAAVDIVGEGAASRRDAGHVLRDRLLATIEGLRPKTRDAPPETQRGYLVLQLRYVEGLDPATAGARLGLARSQFYREQERALRAVSHPPELDDQEALIVRTVPLSSVSDLLMSSELGELTAVAGIGLALAHLQSSAIT
jgi:hypothetical protein